MKEASIKLDEKTIEIEEPIKRRFNKWKPDTRYFTSNSENKFKGNLRFTPKRLGVSDFAPRRPNKNKSFKKKVIDVPIREPSPDGVPIDQERLDRHDTGASCIDPNNARTRVARDRMVIRKQRFVERIEMTARAELLNESEVGDLQTEGTKKTFEVTQEDICSAVDITSATKHFDLILDQFGPYRINYTRNGRHMLLGGRRGHVAAFDWMTKDLMNETNVMETVRDVQWLHVETMYAVAQKRWLRIYDNVGTELHCLKNLFDIKRLEFLPRHMLLVAGSDDGFLHYLDVCVGQLVTSFRTRRGPNNVMTQNPANAIILTGGSRGVVSMWSPNVKEPLVEMLTHRAAVTGVSVDETGTYMATAGLDKRLKLWDLRNYKEVFSYTTAFNFGEITFSQRRHLAAAAGDEVQVFNDLHLGTTKRPYMKHRCGAIITNLQFCPYEDVLGVGHENGFTSLLIPGAGDPNFDALRVNPYESKKQRQEREVRMLLDKLQPEMITLDPSDINKVNLKNLENTLDYKTNVLKIKPHEIKRKKL